MSALVYTCIGIAFLLSCKGSGKPKEPVAGQVAAAATPAEEGPRRVNSVEILSPQKWDTCTFHQTVRIRYAVTRKLPVDSAQVYYNNRYVATLDSTTWEYDLTLPDTRCGTNSIGIKVFHPGDRNGQASLPLVVKPDKAPRRLTHQVARVYLHDPDASTQGLVYHEGFMYESTGIRGKSTLRKTDLEKNQILSMRSLSSHLFGEGVTVYDNKLYQITWTSRRGFVYDIGSFELETEFDYSTQGWGITTMGNRLVMSDGTNQLYHLDPTGFHKVKTVEVFDHKGAVEQLNELEYIDGHIWANVWLTDRIVVIDPHSGAVIQELYLPNMLTPAEKARLDLKEDVLNGIAWHPERKTVFVTGKHWPKLFELTVR